MDFVHLKVFLWAFSLQVGVVTICSIGITLMTTSLWVNLVTQDPEIKNWASAAHWTIVSVFDFSGMGIYTLGMVAVYSESSRLANLTFVFMVLHCLLWLTLTIISFGNWTLMNRAVCIDNRCADRLFIKNGNWRLAFGECENPSMERWLESAGHNREESVFDQANDKVTRGGFPPPQQGTRNHTKALKLSKNLEMFEEEKRLWNITWKAMSKYNKTLIHTPIGYIGCEAPAHIAFSVICALLILAFWYIYPILILKSFANDLSRPHRVHHL